MILENYTNIVVVLVAFPNEENVVFSLFQVRKTLFIRFLKL